MGIIALIYSVVVYVAFFASFLYLIAFVGGDMTAFLGVPKTIDQGASPITGVSPAFVNVCLLALFGLQHTIMARPGFKKAWTKIVPSSMERSTYVLATTVILVLLFVYWIPMPEIVWSADGQTLQIAMLALYGVGIGVVLLATFLINHFELFGLLQGWLRFKKQELPGPRFRTPLLYKNVRHPLYVGWITMFWATSHMTIGHLLFASVWTIYIFIAVGYEERDLIGVFGDKYRDYMAKTPAILPFGGKK